jgi:predicted metal-binding protein
MTPENIVARALELGADDALIFRMDQIVFDPRTLLKCMFGCEDWGKGHTCPSTPGSLKPWEYERILQRYKWGCIVHSTNKKISQDISFALEREAFLAGHYFAFSMSDCAICQECAGFKGKPCVDPSRARPAFHSVGIDVFATVKQFDLPLSTLKSEDEEQNWYSAVFVA